MGRTGRKHPARKTSSDSSLNRALSAGEADRFEERSDTN
jgi:hypothetical protein